MSALLRKRTKLKRASLRPLCANSDLMRRSDNQLFDHPIGDREHARRDCEPERLGEATSKVFMSAAAQ